MKRKNRLLFGTLAIVAALVVSAVFSGSALADKKRPHERLDFPTLRGLVVPEVSEADLTNGMKLFYLEDKELPLINARILVRTGSIFEPAEKLGLAGITGSVMRTGGTTTHPGDTLDELLEGIAAYVETGVGEESGFVTVSCLSENFEQVLGIMADVVRNPVFPEEKIDLARVEYRSAISRRNDDPTGILFREFDRLVHGSDSPFARIMEYEHLNAITRDDLVDFHARYFHPNNCIMAVWGDIDGDRIVEHVEKAFAGWQKSDVEIPAYPVIAPVKASVNLVEKTDLNQSYIAMGHLGVTRDNPDYFALQVMNDIFGTSGFTSRLMRAVRTAEGLTYGVSGGIFSDYKHPDVARMYTFTSLANTSYTIDLLKSELQKLIDGGVTGDEVKLAKDAILNSFVFNFDSTSEVINRLMTYEYYGYPRDFLTKYKTSIEAVTAADVNRVAREHWHPESMALLVVGNPEEFDQPLSEHGEVNVVDITIPEPPPSEEIPEATPETLARGTEIMTGVLAAHGGDALLAMNSSWGKSDIALTTPQGELSISAEGYTVYPDKSWNKINMPFGVMTRVFNGSEGWMEMGGNVQQVPAEEFKKEQARDTMQILRNLESSEYTFQYVDDVEFEGEPAHRVVVKDTAGRSTTLYVSAETNRVAGRRYMGETMMGPGELTEVYGEWKEYEGIQKATLVSVLKDGEQFMTVNHLEFKVNPEVDEALFEKTE